MIRKRYPNYKSSDIEWLGDVPEHWEVKRLKTSVNYWVSNVDKVSNETEFSIFLCNYTDVYYNDFISSDMNFMETTATKEEIKKFHLEVGDVIITKDSESWDDIAVSSLVVTTNPKLVCGYHLAMIRPKRGKILGEFLARQFQSSAINHQFQIAATGVTRYGLPKSAIGEAIVPLPPLSEQQAIAAFLDRETNRIDRLIDKKKKLIELLKEKRTTMISRAVTKGLDTSAKLKPSGMEWVGDVPEHWETWTISHGFLYIGSGTTPPSDELEWYKGNIPWITTSELRENIIYRTEKCVSEEAIRNFSALKIFPKESLVIAMYGATIGRLGILGIKATTNQACCVMYGGKVFDIFFVYYWMQAHRESILLLASGGGQPNISRDKIKSLKIPCPRIPEQQAIVAFIDQETAKIDNLVSKVEIAIDRLKEYRTSLISSAVTGKIDVRDIQ